MKTATKRQVERVAWLIERELGGTAEVVADCGDDRRWSIKTEQGMALDHDYALASLDCMPHDLYTEPICDGMLAVFVHD